MTTVLYMTCRGCSADISTGYSSQDGYCMVCDESRANADWDRLAELWRRATEDATGESAP